MAVVRNVARDKLEQGQLALGVGIRILRTLKALSEIEAADARLTAAAQELRAEIAGLREALADADGVAQEHLTELRRLVSPAYAVGAGGKSAAGELQGGLETATDSSPSVLAAPLTNCSDDSRAVGDGPIPFHGECVGSLDSMYGRTVNGWVWDPRSPASRATVEFFVNGEIVYRAQGNIYRPDVKSAGFGTGFAGFAGDLPITIGGDGVAVHARLAGTKWALDNSPIVGAPNIAKWMNRSKRITAKARLRLQARLDREIKGLVSIVMPIYDTEADWLPGSHCQRHCSMV